MQTQCQPTIEPVNLSNFVEIVLSKYANRGIGTGKIRNS